MPTDYSAVDAAILAALSTTDPVRFDSLWRRDEVNAAALVAEEHRPSFKRDAYRVVDRRLQALRVAGKAIPAPARKGWLKVAA